MQYIPQQQEMKKHLQPLKQLLNHPTIKRLAKQPSGHNRRNNNNRSTTLETTGQLQSQQQLEQPNPTTMETTGAATIETTLETTSSESIKATNIRSQSTIQNLNSAQYFPGMKLKM
ncbi:hypothetical protein TNIN_28611 [Trichonephila inaurata madagascariensis]|uniref:Uncharacterized protein n=1 Tax=Trichonephila inaurata madagascariensis TaxID=2747483 RepID=A0A8X6KFR0_9ARAC|nr:hypothetical protein TNIN_28611 [Trichonephila inaurata madagascariensis]